MKKVRVVLTAAALTLAVGLGACTGITAPEDCPPDSQGECITHGPNTITHGPNT